MRKEPLAVLLKKQEAVVVIESGDSFHLLLLNSFGVNLALTAIRCRDLRRVEGLTL